MFKNIGFGQFKFAKLLIAVIIFSAAFEASAAWGDLDTSFGSGGIYQETASGENVGDVIVQPDGKILVTGSKLASNGKKRFFLRRYLANGTPDTSFGNNGSAVINSLINPNYDYGGSQVSMLTASKIAVLGYMGNNIAVWMVNGDGSGNTSFGSGGFKFLNGYDSNPSRLGALSGKMVIGFYDPSNLRVAIIKLNTDGSIDTTFGGDGRVHVNIFGKSDRIPPFEMITEPDTRKITIAGLSLVAPNSPIRLERRLSDGSYDYSFSASGNEDPGNAVFTLNGLEKLSSGKYIYHHIIIGNGLPYGSLTRTSSSGTLEQRFSTGFSGKLHGVQPDGLIVTEGGYFINRFDQNFNFLDNFPTPTNLGGFDYRTHAFQADNKMIVAGIMDDKLTIMRLLAN